MDKSELTKLGAERLAEAVLVLGHIIRSLDEDSEYLDYWTHDGEYVTYIPDEAVKKHVRFPEARR